MQGIGQGSTELWSDRLQEELGDRFAVSPEFRITFCQPPDDSAPWAAMRLGVKAAVRF